MSRKKITLLFAVAFLIGIFTGCTEQGKPGNLIEIFGQTMGTTYSVKIVKFRSGEINFTDEEIKVKIDSILVVVNQQMSTYIDSSEISLFNNSKSEDWFKVSEDFLNVVDKAQSISKESGGAFDITVGPLVNLWGFGPKFTNDKIPSDDEILNIKSEVGYHFLFVDDESSSLRKEKPGLCCDLSSIAKGFGVDKVAGYLESIGAANYLVEIGGEVKTKGKNHLNKIWKIGVSTPDNQSGIIKVVELENLSMATSGDYRNYFEKDGIRYSHTIDPRTGRPINHKLASVSVISESCIEADGYATAINVLGPVEGYKFASEMNLNVYMIVREGEEFIEKMTPGFEKLLAVNNNSN